MKKILTGIFAFVTASVVLAGTQTNVPAQREAALIPALRASHNALMDRVNTALDESDLADLTVTDLTTVQWVVVVTNPALVYLTTLTPAFAGQAVVDAGTTNRLWVASGVTTNDWEGPF